MLDRLLMVILSWLIAPLILFFSRPAQLRPLLDRERQGPINSCSPLPARLSLPCRANSSQTADGTGPAA